MQLLFQVEIYIRHNFFEEEIIFRRFWILIFVKLFLFSREMIICIKKINLLIIFFILPPRNVFK